LPELQLETQFFITVGLTDSHGTATPLMASMIFHCFISISGTFLYISLNSKQTSNKLISNSRWFLDSVAADILLCLLVNTKL
jgi:hypothetical protein